MRGLVALAALLLSFGCGGKVGPVQFALGDAVSIRCKGQGAKVLPTGEISGCDEVTVTRGGELSPTVGGIFEPAVRGAAAFVGVPQGGAPAQAPQPIVIEVRQAAPEPAVVE